jgi:hypothetical protein
MQQRLVFCDESGNTGANLLDSDQHVLVYAFVVMAPASLSQLIDELQEMYRREGITLGELKSGQLIGSLRGRKRYETVGWILSGLGTRIFLSVVEKRYQACSMIAETFLDPFLHEFAPSEMRDRHFRQKFSDACYEVLDDARLTEFLTAVRSDDAAEIVAFGKRLSATLRLHPDDFVSLTAGRMEIRPEAVFRYSKQRENFPKNSHFPASQYAGFYPGLQCVESHLVRIDATAIVLRDEDAQFGEPLDLAVARGRELDRLPGAGDYGALPLNHIESCRSATSAREPGIQIADLAAGLFGRVAHTVLVGEKVAPATQTIAEAWRGTFDADGQHYLMVSNARLQHVSAAIFGGTYAQ